MSVLSVFVDESGDFGSYSRHSPYYIVTLIFHEQDNDIFDNIRKLDTAILSLGLQGRAIHTGPLIRREGDYIHRKIDERQHILNCLFNFSRTTAFTYKTVVAEKKQMAGSVDLNTRLVKILSSFFAETAEIFNHYKKILVYYDNGQIELTRILVSLFNILHKNVEFRKILPSDYKMAQVADLVCTMELLALKAENKKLSKSEIAFFGTQKRLEKNYIRVIRKKRLQKKNSLC